MKVAVDHLRSVCQLTIEHIHEWMDGCPSQYKAKESAADVSHSSADFGFTRTRNFFGSEHGKGESDGATGNLKSNLEMAIPGEKAVICNAEDCYKYCIENYATVLQDQRVMF